MLTVADTRQSCGRLVQYQGGGGGDEYSNSLSSAHGSRHKAKFRDACSVSWEGGGDNSQGLKGAHGSRDKAKLWQGFFQYEGGGGYVDENNNGLKGAHDSKYKAKFREACSVSGVGGVDDNSNGLKGAHDSKYKAKFREACSVLGGGVVMRSARPERCSRHQRQDKAVGGLVSITGRGSENSQGLKGAHSSRPKAKLWEDCSAWGGGGGDENSKWLSVARGGRPKAKLVLVWSQYRVKSRSFRVIIYVYRSRSPH